MQSNGYFTEGFCIHSQTHVAVSSGNRFEPGVIVSMPDHRNVERPSSGFTSNSGLSAPPRAGSFACRGATILPAGPPEPAGFFRSRAEERHPLSRNGAEIAVRH